MDKLQRFVEKNPVGKIDRENGVIYGVSVITGNREATGHEMYVDEVMVSQVVEHGNANQQGLKARFDHPNPCAGSMGTAVGRFKNFRKDGLQARADLHIFEAAAKAEFDYRDYILTLAEEDPNAFATSIVFRQDEPEQFDPNSHKDKDENDPFFYPHARIKALTHCDVVDEGAANEGLFGRPNYLAEQAERFLKERTEEVETLLEPLVTKIVNSKIKDMSTVKLSLIDRMKALFTEGEQKTDEQLSAEYNELKTEATALQKANEDNERTIAELQLAAETSATELSELKEGYETKIAELTQSVADLEKKLSQPEGELPAAAERDSETETAELSPTAKVAKSISENIRKIEELKSKK
jgi:hypothetical protein